MPNRSAIVTSKRSAEATSWVGGLGESSIVGTECADGDDDEEAAAESGDDGERDGGDSLGHGRYSGTRAPSC